jgi:putative ABC transport system substrate-binding protein
MTICLRRREFIAGLGGAVTAWPLTAQAQQESRVRRVGVLLNAAATEVEHQSYLAAFVAEMRRLGWSEGRNLRLDIRWNGGDAVLSRTYAAELIGLMPDLIVTESTVSLMAVQQETKTIPIVFVQVADPLTQGFVPNMRRPGGNLTGFSFLEFSLGGKWLDLLKEAAPSLERIAIFFNPDTAPQFKFFMQAIEAAASSRRVKAIATPIRASSDIETAIASFALQPNGGPIVYGDSFTRLHTALIVDLADRYHLPSIGADPDFAKSGGLMDYSPAIDILAHFRQAANYVDRILKGEKPGIGSSSISRPPRHSGSPCRSRCAASPTR